MIRFEIRVRPRARANRVGGSWGGQRALLVEVQAPAVDGKANKAVETVVAKAFAVRRSQVTIVAGNRSRSKVIELDPGPGDPARAEAELERRLAELRGPSGDGDRGPTD
jgi:uncharacterized protein (TIGR00251 family)